MRRPLVALAAALVALAPAVGAQEADLTLVVRGADTGAPLPGALIEIFGSSGLVDDFGQASLSGVPVGDVPVRVSYAGYFPLDTLVAVAPDDNNLTVLTLRPDLVDLGDVVVEAESVNDAVLRRRGFFDRRDDLTGVFFTRAELDQRGASQFSDIFGSVPGVRVQRSAGLTSLISQRRRGCAMTVFVDGVEMAYVAQNINSLPYDDIAAIEVYRGPAELPIEYAYMKTGDTCGAVLVWTRIVASND